MSDHNDMDFLKKLLESKEQRIKELEAESKKHRLGKSKVKQEFEAFKAEHLAFKGEFEKLSQEVERYQKDPAAEQINQLRAELRQLKHFDAFKAVAQGLKVKDSAVADLYKLSGYQAESDDVDIATLKEVVAKAVESRPYFVSTEVSASTPTPVTKLNPGPGASRGKITELGGFRMTAADANSPAFMRRHQKEIAEATKNGTLIFESNA